MSIVEFRARKKAFTIPATYESGGKEYRNPKNQRVRKKNGVTIHEPSSFTFQNGVVTVDPEQDPEFYKYLLNYPLCVDCPAYLPSGKDSDSLKSYAEIRAARLQDRNLRYHMRSPRVEAQAVIQQSRDKMSAFNYLSKVFTLDGSDVEIKDERAFKLVYLALTGKKTIVDPVVVVSVMLTAASDQPKSVLGAAKNPNVVAAFMISELEKAGVVSIANERFVITTSDGTQEDFAGTEEAVTYFAGHVRGDDNVPIRQKELIKLALRQMDILKSKPEAKPEAKPRAVAKKKSTKSK